MVLTNQNRCGPSWKHWQRRVGIPGLLDQLHRQPSSPRGKYSGGQVGGELTLHRVSLNSTITVTLFSVPFHTLLKKGEALCWCCRSWPPGYAQSSWSFSDSQQLKSILAHYTPSVMEYYTRSVIEHHIPSLIDQYIPFVVIEQYSPSVVEHYIPSKQRKEWSVSAAHLTRSWVNSKGSLSPNAVQAMPPQCILSHSWCLVVEDEDWQELGAAPLSFVWVHIIPPPLERIILPVIEHFSPSLL